MPLYFQKDSFDKVLQITINEFIGNYRFGNSERLEIKNEKIDDLSFLKEIGKIKHLIIKDSIIKIKNLEFNDKINHIKIYDADLRACESIKGKNELSVADCRLGKNISVEGFYDVCMINCDTSILKKQNYGGGLRIELGMDLIGAVDVSKYSEWISFGRANYSKLDKIILPSNTIHFQKIFHARPYTVTGLEYLDIQKVFPEKVRDLYLNTELKNAETQKKLIEKNLQSTDEKIAKLNFEIAKSKKKISYIQKLKSKFI